MARVMMKISVKQYYSLLQQYLLPQRKEMVLLTVLLVISIVMQLVNPQIIRYFIDTAQSGKEWTPLYYAAGLFIGFSLFHQIISVIATFMSENICWKTTNKLRGDLAAHCLSLDMS